MNEWRQKNFVSIGVGGCYLLCIVHLAETLMGRYIDPYETYLNAFASGKIKDDCFVVDPEGILSDLTNMRWTMTKQPANYTCKDGELEIQRWEWQEVGTLHGHFVCADWDPMGTSLTKTNGSMVSKRIFS